MLRGRIGCPKCHQWTLIHMTGAEKHSTYQHVMFVTHTSPIVFEHIVSSVQWETSVSPRGDDFLNVS